MITRIRLAILLALITLPFDSSTLSAEEFSQTDFLKIGRDLFEREWKPGEPASPGGDGLGPNFNDVSCVACHNLGGIGGGGPIEKNVDLVSLPPRTRLMTNVQLRRLEGLHPGFFLDDGEINSSIVLHRFSTKPGYNARRVSFIGERSHVAPHSVVRDLMQKQLSERPLRAISAAGPQFIQSQRNTTALFGAALIDAIPDRVLHRVAREQAQRFAGISGRVTLTAAGAGHFGWRGNTRRLQDFVLTACGNEVGLRVPGVDQAMVPDAPKYQPVGFDMSPQQSAAMIAFVASLPRPYQTNPRNKAHATVVAVGIAAFSKIGCAICHVRNLGGVDGLYSDLLLHDMGQGLKDPAPAQAELMTIQQAENLAVATGQALPQVEQDDVKLTQTRPPSYYGGSHTASREFIEYQTTNIYQEWRTPPLWGVQDSAPYLHDGRAATLSEAILMHGGEAAPSAANYIALDHLSRLTILEFLGTLRSPFVKAPFVKAQ
jgi:CxxC motif-containing protein (DUF1111 family)